MKLEFEDVLIGILTVLTPTIGFFLKRHMKNVDSWINKQHDLEKQMLVVTDNLVSLQKQMQTSLDNQSTYLNLRIDNMHSTMVEIKNAIVEQQKILQHMDKNQAIASIAIERFMKLEDRIMVLEKEKNLHN